jgi:uracil-DNA glycosylase
MKKSIPYENEHEILIAIKKIIKKNELYDYLKDFPWLKGYIGNPNSSVWFIGENPSLDGVKKVHDRNIEHSENLQWNSHSGDWLLRNSLTELGFKEGDSGENVGWHCYITNVIKEPETVAVRNKKKKDKNYWHVQALRWLPILQLQLDSGKPKVLVAMGGQTLEILRFMKINGLKAPEFDFIPHYSYIMKRPDRSTNLGPGHPLRIKEYKEAMTRIKNKYGI